MSLTYYLADMGNGKKKLIKGDPDDWLAFAVFQPETKTWDYSSGAFWADQLLVDGFDDFEIISNSRANNFMEA